MTRYILCAVAFLLLVGVVPVQALLEMQYHSFVSYVDVASIQALKHRNVVLSPQDAFATSSPVYVIKSSMNPFLITGILMDPSPKIGYAHGCRGCD